MVSAKPAVIYDAEVISPYSYPYATSSQYVARNYNGYYVADSPYFSSYSSYPLTAAYTPYVL